MNISIYCIYYIYIIYVLYIYTYITSSNIFFQKNSFNNLISCSDPPKQCMYIYIYMYILYIYIYIYIYVYI